MSHTAADGEDTTLVSGQQTDTLVDLFTAALLLPNGDLYYLVSVNVSVHSVMAFLLGRT